jgi:hypothetical protein
MILRNHTALACAFGLGLGLMPVYLVEAAAPSPATAEAPVAASADPAAAPDHAASKADSKKADARNGDGKKKGDAKMADGEGATGRRAFDSLMFNTDELNEIQGRLASGGVADTNQGAQAIEDATLYLSTILYYGPKDWTI